MLISCVYQTIEFNVIKVVRWHGYDEPEVDLSSEREENEQIEETRQQRLGFLDLRRKATER